MKVQIKMALVKETKNCYRYEAAETNPPAGVDCIYLQKRELQGSAAPKQVLVTVEVAA